MTEPSFDQHSRLQRDALMAEYLGSWGELRLVRVEPKADAELLHSWVTEDRARFWGMLDTTVEDVEETYRHLDLNPTQGAFLFLLNGEPLALMETYSPLHDPVGLVYPAQAEDIGMHLLLAPATRPIPHFTPVLGVALLAFLFSDPLITRVVAEPDARNQKAIRRLQATGFELGPVVQLPDKEAQLTFLTRERYARLRDIAAARRR